MSAKTSSRLKQKRRSGEPSVWVSTNRVLNGNNSAMKKANNCSRNPNFDTEETKLLIQLWGDPKVQRTLITTHKKHAVICQLAIKMQEQGYHRSPEEITTRIKNLKCFYNRLKKDMETGQLSANEPTWKHFAEMDAIMTRPIFSVRPNEVPAPSLKYQLEKAREEREERRKKLEEGGGTPSDSEEGLEDLIARTRVKGTAAGNRNDIDDGIIPDVEVDIDISDEAFVALTHAAESSVKYGKRRKLAPKVATTNGITNTNTHGNDNHNEHDMPDSEQEDKENSKFRVKEEQQPADEEPHAANESTNNASDNSNNHHGGLEKVSKPKETLEANRSAAILIPKEEPIDVDADDDSQNPSDTPVPEHVQAMMPTLADILKMSKNSHGNAASAVVIPVPVSAVSCAVTSASSLSDPPSSSSSSPSKAVTTSAPITVSSGAQPTTAQQGKISLVPTNFLMQPRPSPTPTSGMSLQQPKIHLLPNALNAPPAPRILQATPTNTGIMTTGPGGMKVLLVNADQAAANQLCNGPSAGLSPQLATTAKSLSTVLPLANAMLQPQTLPSPQQQQQQQQQQQPSQQSLKHQKQKEALQQQQQQQKKKQQQQQQYEQERREKREELMSKKDATGMRILLRQLLNAQTENNEIQHQRLALERERLDFEKSIADRFLAALPNFVAQFQQHQPPQLQQQPHQHHQQQQQQQTQQIFQSHAQFAATGTALRLNAPKFVFATAPMQAAMAGSPMVTAAATTTTLLTPSTLSSSLPKVAKPVEICTQINDMQLLTPKVEKPDD